MPGAGPGHLPWFAPPPLSDSPQLPSPTQGNVLVVGAGLAGCTTAYELSRRGWKVTVLEQAPHAASAASNNRAAVLRPHITREPTLASHFFIDGSQAMLKMLQRVDADRQPSDGTNLSMAKSDAMYGLPGVLQLLTNARKYPDSSCYEKLDPAKASYRAGIRLNSDTLFFADAGWVNMALLCQTLLDQSEVQFFPNRRVLSLQQNEGSKFNEVKESSWKVRSCQHGSSKPTDEVRTDTYDKVVLASGLAIAALAQTEALTLTPARGQTTFLSAPQSGLKSILCGKQTVIPLNGGDNWQVGSTYQRHCLDSDVSDADDRENLAMLEQMLRQSTSPSGSGDGSESAQSSSKPASAPYSELTQSIHGSWAAIRATTPDRLPVLGPLPDFAFFETEYRDLRHGRSIERYKPARYQSGLYVNGGYGSRGLSVAAYCATLLADVMERNTAQRRVAQGSAALGVITQAGATQTSASSAMTKDSQIMELLHPARFLIRQLRRDRTIEPD